MSDLSGMDLLRLHGTCLATRMGMVDRGLGPKYEAYLEAGGYIKKQDTTDFVTGKKAVGYVATTLGFETVKKEKHRLFPPKKKEKKRQMRREEYYDEEEY
jgi:hypothetical protein